LNISLQLMKIILLFLMLKEFLSNW